VIDGFAHQEIVAQTPCCDAREFGELDERKLLSAVQYLATRKFSYRISSASVSPCTALWERRD
jgi:hypothetical protein